MNVTAEQSNFIEALADEMVTSNKSFAIFPLQDGGNLYVLYRKAMSNKEVREIIRKMFEEKDGA